MKIVLDVTIVTRPDKVTGIERVALETVKSILRDNKLRTKEHSFFVLCSNKGYNLVLKEIKQIPDLAKVKVYKSFTENRIYTDQIWLPLKINSIKPDYVYYTTLGVPLINRYPFSMIIHDAVAWALPNTISKGMKYYYKPIIEKAAHHDRLDKIMTVSKYSKSEIVRYLRINEEKIFVNYLGISESFTNYSNKEIEFTATLRKYGVNEDYIIALGTLEPRKNIHGLIHSFGILKKKFGYKGKLVIVGRKGWIDKLEISEEIKEDILFTGFVDDRELPILLKCSCLFVFPSFYEGFGLPLIESMALGVPVVSSNRTSLLEIGEGACEFFDPYNYEEMAEVMHKVLMEDTLMKEMANKGKEKAAQFSWSRHAETLNNVLFTKKR
ncbi:mannosyl transferase [Bacillus sp. HMSC76G11]|nr:mannosyl transferase [Bacillus sp. HMSC76G11]